MTTENPHCGGCRFWSGNRQDFTAQAPCHRYPPMPAGLVQSQGIAGPQQGVVSSLPTTAHRFWCGEFMPAANVSLVQT